MVEFEELNLIQHFFAVNHVLINVGLSEDFLHLGLLHGNIELFEQQSELIEEEVAVLADVSGGEDFPQVHLVLLLILHLLHGLQQLLEQLAPGVSVRSGR